MEISSLYHGDQLFKILHETLITRQLRSLANSQRTLSDHYHYTVALRGERRSDEGISRKSQLHGASDSFERLLLLLRMISPLHSSEDSNISSRRCSQSIFITQICSKFDFQPSWFRPRLLWKKFSIKFSISKSSEAIDGRFCECRADKLDRNFSIRRLATHAVRSSRQIDLSLSRDASAHEPVCRALKFDKPFLLKSKSRRGFWPSLLRNDLRLTLKDAKTSSFRLMMGGKRQ